MTFRITRVDLELETLCIVQQRFFFWFWIQPWREFRELVQPQPGYITTRYG